MTSRYPQVVVLLSLVLPIAAQAQWPQGIQPGARVRVTVPEQQRQRGNVVRGQELRGTLARVSPDTLYLAVTDSLGPLAVPRALIRRIDLSRGVPSRGASALRRGVITGALGALAGVLVVAGDNQPGGASEGDGALVGGVLGLATGAVLGAVFPVERWRRVRLEPLATAGRIDGGRLTVKGHF